MSNNNKSFDEILKSFGGKIDRRTVESAAKSGKADALVNSLSAEDKQKLNEIMQDKQKLNEVLKSPQAMAILKFLQGGKGKNG